MTGSNSPLSRPVKIVEYDLSWPDLFEFEKRQILLACTPARMILEHIGSTSIPGLAAKPTIDILAGIESLNQAGSIIPKLQSLGYIYVPEFEVDLPERRYFYKGREVEDAFHVHMVEIDSPFWKRHIAFRNYLRCHPEEVREYEALKRTLATKFGADREGYTDAKTEFITRIEKFALA